MELLKCTPLPLYCAVLSGGKRADTLFFPPRSAAALRERAVPSVEAASPHPLKLLLHNLCRAVVREATITPVDLSDLLAKEDQARHSPPEKIRRRTDTIAQCAGRRCSRRRVLSRGGSGAAA